MKSKYEEVKNANFCEKTNRLIFSLGSLRYKIYLKKQSDLVKINLHRSFYKLNLLNEQDLQEMIEADIQNLVSQFTSMLRSQKFRVFVCERSYKDAQIIY